MGWGWAWMGGGWCSGRRGGGGGPVRKGGGGACVGVGTRRRVTREEQPWIHASSRMVGERFSLCSVTRPSTSFYVFLTIIAHFSSPIASYLSTCWSACRQIVLFRMPTSQKAGFSAVCWCRCHWKWSRKYLASIQTKIGFTPLS